MPQGGAAMASPCALLASPAEKLASLRVKLASLRVRARKAAEVGERESCAEERSLERRGAGGGSWCSCASGGLY